ncbi:hypothetical protein [Undibacterium sp.]
MKEKYLSQAAEKLTQARKSRPDKMTEQKYREQAARLIAKANRLVK